MKVKSLSFKYYKFIERFAALVIVAYTLIGCDTEEWPTYRLVPDFKAYVLFPVGSYWVYSQQGNTRKDSVYLQDQKLELVRWRNLSSNIEQLDQTMSSSFYDDTLIGYSRIDKGTDTIICFYTERFRSKRMDGNLQFYTGLPLGDTMYNGTMGAKFSEALDAYSVNGTVYREVKAFENIAVLDSLYVKKIYYAKGVGVIRKELFNGDIWNLEKYKID